MRGEISPFQQNNRARPRGELLMSAPRAKSVSYADIKRRCTLPHAGNPRIILTQASQCICAYFPAAD